MVRIQRRALLRGFRLAHRGEQGFSLIEVVIALGILAAVAVIFLVGMQTSSRAVIVTHESVVAESLAKSQVEYIKSQPYIKVVDYSSSDPSKSYQLLTIEPDLASLGYMIAINTPQNVTGGDENLQSITITVSRNGETEFTLVNYKVNR